MASRHELGMDSYDRLIPGQDTMPRGGLASDLAAFSDEQQWAHLHQAHSRLTVERIASDAARAGSVVGVHVAVVADDRALHFGYDRLPGGRDHRASSGRRDGRHPIT
jgi:hypothetical protein